MCPLVNSLLKYYSAVKCTERQHKFLLQYITMLPFMPPIIFGY